MLKSKKIFLVALSLFLLGVPLINTQVSAIEQSNFQDYCLIYPTSSLPFYTITDATV